MANLDKNIIITPNKSSASDDPKIVFSAANTANGPYNITLKTYPTNNGTLSFEGTSGQLFSISNTMSGTIFSVNDVSGIPSIEVLDTGVVKLAQYGGNVGLGTSNPTVKLHTFGMPIVNGGARYVALFDENQAASAGRGGGIAFAQQGSVLGGIFSYEEASSAAAAAMVFSTVSASTVSERMRITSNGQLNLNTTWLSGWGSDYRLGIKSTNTNNYNGIVIECSTNGSGMSLAHTGSVGVISMNYGASGTYYPLTFDIAGERMRIHTSGGVSIGNTTDPGATNLSVTGRSTLTGGIQGTVQRGSYGSVSVYGNSGAYAGFDINDYALTWMANSSSVSFGVYKTNNAWAFYFDYAGVLQVGTVPGGSVTGNISGNAATATKLSTTTTGTAPAYANRGWASFASGGTISESVNVSSISYFAVGNHGVNLTTAMTTANYAYTGSTTGTAADAYAIVCEFSRNGGTIHAQTASQFTVITCTGGQNNSFRNPDRICAMAYQ